MFNFKTIIQGAGVQHVINGVSFDTPQDVTIFQQGNNVSTMWNGTTIINNTQYWDDDED